jgi:hypothetical protein
VARELLGEGERLLEFGIQNVEFGIRDVNSEFFIPHSEFSVPHTLDDHGFDLATRFAENGRFLVLR